MWIYENKEFTEIPAGFTGFVYKITNLVDGREYFGKKLFWFTKTKIIKKKKKKIKEESDWKEYYSSSEELKQDVLKLGKENFKREILFLCKNKGMMGYLEAKLQFQHEVLEIPNKFYNKQISCRIHHSHVKI
jgi:hypothetical protein